MPALTAKKGRPTINKPSKTEAWYCLRKADNTPAFNRMAKKRREHAKFCAKARRKNR